MNLNKLASPAIVPSILICCVAPQVEAANSALAILNRFNVIVGDYNAGNETEGSAFVYGAYTASGSSRFGFNGGSAADDSENMLWLNNGVANSGTTTLLSGSVLSRVSVSSSLFNLNGNAPGTPSLTIGDTPWGAALQSELGLNLTTDVVDTLASASLHWAGLASNSSVTLPGNGGLAFNASPVNIDGVQVAIFSLTVAELENGTFSRFDLSLNGAATVLVNVSGSSVTINKSFNGDFGNNESKVLFNFFEATSVTLNTNFRGGVFAPNAAVFQTGSNVDGSVVAASFSQTAEVHDVRFNGYLPIPEPSVSMLGFLGAALMFRRRR